MKTKSTLSAMFLLAIALFAPACDVLDPDVCNPEVEVCVDPVFPTDVKKAF